jgi:hypothetical protein
MDDTSYAVLKTYIRRLGWALASLPERDRDDIVEETRLHVLARVEQGQTLDDALAALGAAERYASRFIDEMEVVGALATGRSGAMLSVVFRHAHRSLVALLAGLAVLLLGSVGLGCIFAAIMKQFDPQHIGLWTSASGTFRLGLEEHPENYHELLGVWFYPFTFAGAAVSFLLCRLVLNWTLAAIARRE